MLQKMGQKDISEKVLADYNDVFADIVNVLIFHGEEKVKPKDLENALVHSQYKAEDGCLHEEERDVCKYWKRRKIAFSIIGLENQTSIDRYMPFRIISYDGASYKTQLSKKPKRIVPVVTFVLYFGVDRRWNRQRTIKELLDIPEGLEDYVNDYKIHVFEIAWLTDKQLKMFKSDFGIVANFFVQKRKNKDYVPDDKRVIKHVDEVLKLLSVMSGDRKYERILFDEKKGKVSTMCEVAERLVNKGRTEGMLEGMREGIRKGRHEGETMLAVLINNLLSEGRSEDVALAAKDEEARKRFYKEFGIID